MKKFKQLLHVNKDKPESVSESSNSSSLVPTKEDTKKFKQLANIKKDKSLSESQNSGNAVSQVNFMEVHENHGIVSQGIQSMTYFSSTVEKKKKKTSYKPQDQAAVQVREEVLSCTKELSVINKYEVAENIGDQWKKLASFLPGAGFSSGQLYVLKSDSLSQTELVVDILNKWYEVAPEKATVGNLALALKQMKFAELANSLSLE